MKTSRGQDHILHCFAIKSHISNCLACNGIGDSGKQHAFLKRIENYGMILDFSHGCSGCVEQQCVAIKRF